MSTKTVEDLHEYWDYRAESYGVQDVFGRRILTQFIRHVQPTSLVEVGCGPGTLFPLYHNVPRVVAVDWSRKMLERARRRIKRHEYSNIRLYQMDMISGVSSEVESLASYCPFDVVVTRTFLMHIPPEHFKEVCRHVSTLSDELLLFEYWEQYVTRKLDWHNWRHDYMETFTGLGYALKEGFPRPDIKQVLYHFKKET